MVPWTIACQAPQSMGFYRQEYWSVLPFPPPGDLLHPGIPPASLTSPAMQAGSLPLGASLMAQMVKNLPAMQETQVQSLGQEDPLQKEMATHSSILAWRIPWIEEPSGPQAMGHKESDTTERLVHTYILLIGASLMAQMVKNLPAK